MSRRPGVAGRSGSSRTWRTALALTLLSAAFASCAGAPAAPEGGVPLETRAVPDPVRAERGAIEAALFRGTPSSFSEAAILALSAQHIPAVDAQAYRYLAFEAASIVYGQAPGGAASVDPPIGHPWVAALSDAKAGRSPRDPADRLADFFALLAAFRTDSKELARGAIEAAVRVRSRSADSTLAALSEARARESRAEHADALLAWEAALALDPANVPALLGRVRALLALGRPAEAAGVVESASLPPSRERDKLYARALFASGRKAEAEPLVAKVLTSDPLDADFLLMRASMLADSGAWRQAAPLLDALGGLRPNDRAYLLLRVRSALEGTRNREDAERWARKALATFPGDLELALIASEVLATGTREDLAESRTLAALVLAASPGDSRALHTLLAASAALGDWADAAARVDAIRRAGLDLLDDASAFEAYLRTGRLAEAAGIADAWVASAPGNESATLALLRVRVLRGERAAAADLAAKALASGGSARFRSTVFYLQSRTQVADDSILSSLRSALVEDASNVEALAALYDYYARRSDLEKARFYLRQALSLAPGDPELAKRSEDLAARGVATP
ncbi:MAG TPA: hypothetical protein PKW82_00060 [Spirochaetales bacterium]|nr:hypothetical protein [Spirochaetales bacterium]